MSYRGVVHAISCVLVSRGQFSGSFRSAFSYPAVSWQGLGESRARGQAHALTLSVVATTKNVTLSLVTVSSLLIPSWPPAVNSVRALT